MNYKIEKVAVLGSGVMGSQIAAHLANAGIQSYLLDIVPSELTEAEIKKGLTLESPEVRNRFVQKGFDFAKKVKPAAFYDKSFAKRIKIGNFDDNLDWVSDADWVIEVILEKLEPKKQLLAKVDKLRKPGTIVSSNTSGISIKEMSEDLSDDFKKHFLGTHFFNPPRYLKLLEIIKTEHTSPEVVKYMSDFGDKVLGKGIVNCKDTPNFIANRIGIFAMLHSLKVMIDSDMNAVEVDKIAGPATGKPKSALFRTLDVVGLDTALNVAKNIYDAAPNDERREVFVMPDFVNKMVADKWLGQKTGQGFYKKTKENGKTKILYLDHNTMEYKESPKVKYESLANARNISGLANRMKMLAYAEDKAGKYVWDTLSDTLIYSANRIPEISDNIINIDNAMKWGFGWEMGPFETWDAIGLEKSIARMKEEGKTIPTAVEEMVSSGKKTFYENREGQVYFYDFDSKDYQPVEKPKGITVLKSLKERNKVIMKNKGASLIDLGDGVACLEFHSKMNALGGDIISMVNKSIKEVDQNYEGLVIGNQGKNFSVGANIMLVLLAAQEGEWDEIDFMVRNFQKTAMNIKYASKPVVSAPFGMSLGGGCELSIAASRMVAGAETYMGLVEVGVGVIPGGGGVKEMTLRALDKMAPNEANPLKYLQPVFETIGMGKVATSCQEARNFGFIRNIDRVVMNQDRQIEEAKKTVLSLVAEGYQAPTPRNDLLAVGRSVLSTLKLGLYTMQQGGYISDHDKLIGTKLSNVICGGDLITPRKVSEQYFLDLEREAFVSLCGTRKTQQRIAHMLKKGKPLRN